MNLAEGLSGENATYEKAKGYPLPNTVVVLGVLEEVIYSVYEKGQLVYYKHTWDEERPFLTTSPEGKGLFLIGGNQTVTERGIED